MTILYAFLPPIAILLSLAALRWWPLPGSRGAHRVRLVLGRLMFIVAPTLAACDAGGLLDVVRGAADAGAVDGGADVCISADASSCVALPEMAAYCPDPGLQAAFFCKADATLCGCVASAADPSYACCPSPTPCAHSICAAGTPLALECDPCVAKVCEQAPTFGCCSVGWTEKCAYISQQICGNVCGTTGSCAHSICATGAALPGNVDNACDPCAASVCSLRPACCTDAWDQACVNLVGPSACGISCP